MYFDMCTCCCLTHTPARGLVVNKNLKSEPWRLDTKIYNKKMLITNSMNSEQTPHSVASDLVLNYLSMCHKRGRSRYWETKSYTYHKTVLNFECVNPDHQVWDKPSDHDLHNWHLTMVLNWLLYINAMCSILMLCVAYSWNIFYLDLNSRKQDQLSFKDPCDLNIFLL